MSLQNISYINRNKVWDGLGTSVDEAMTAEEAINAHVVDKGGVRRVPGRKNHKNYTIFMTQRVRTLLLQIYNMEKKKDGFAEHRYVFGFYEPWS